MGCSESTTAETSEPPPFLRKRMIWFWKSGGEWRRFSDFENDCIEEAYQQQKTEIQLNNYVIDLKNNLQIDTLNKIEQRQLKREEIDLGNYVREEKFCSMERPVPTSFAKGRAAGDFEMLTSEKYKQYIEDVFPDWRGLAEKAAQGILKEGIALKEEFDAKKMADQLRSCKNKEEILKCAARLYTNESFLYKLVNLSLRNQDLNKIPTLGPFCVLLNTHLATARSKAKDEIVYRGVKLTDEMIKEYKQFVGQSITYFSFTSTSKDRDATESFDGNVLFIIHLKKSILQPHSDISSLSRYPNEQEVLLKSGTQLQIDKVEFDETNKKTLIYMTAKRSFLDALTTAQDWSSE